MVALSRAKASSHYTNDEDDKFMVPSFALFFLFFLSFSLSHFLSLSIFLFLAFAFSLSLSFLFLLRFLLSLL